MCTADGDLLLIHRLEDLEDVFAGGAGGAGTCKGDTAARAPVACFRAPSPIVALDCRGAGIALGCQSGGVLLLRAAAAVTVVLT